MESTPEKKPIPRFANIAFWIGFTSFIVSMTVFLLMGVVEDSRMISEDATLYRWRLIVNKLTLIVELWIVAPMTLVSLILHPRWWAKGISLLLFAYVVFGIWAMQSS